MDHVRYTEVVKSAMNQGYLRPTVCACIVALACTTWSGCSSTTEKVDPKALHELPDEHAQNSAEESSAHLLDQAQEYFQHGLYTLARGKFEALKGRRDALAYSEYAAVKAADCQFFSGDLVVAIEEYLSFVEGHPTSPLVPYALFYAGQAHELKDPGIGRDPSPLYKAKELFEKVIREHPRSSYSRLALQHFLATEERLQKHRANVTEFYSDNGMANALRARLNTASLEKKKHFDTAEELRDILKDAPQIDPEDEISAPDKQAAQPKDRVSSSASIEFNALLTETAPISEKNSMLEVQKVVCSPNQWDMVLYLDKEPTEEVDFSIEGGLVLFKIHEVQQISDLPQECSEWTVRNQNVLSRRGSSSAEVLHMQNPARIVLFSGQDKNELP